MNTVIFIITLFVKNLFMLIILIFMKNLNQVCKFLNLKLVIESGLISIRIFLAKVTQKNGQKYL